MTFPAQSDRLDSPACARRAGLLRLALVLLIVLLIGAPSLIYPFGRDQGEYATIAELALRGRVIYRDVFNVKPPATHLLHALALTLFGRSMQAIRWLDLLWQAATALVLLRIADRVGLNRRLALLAPVLYAIAYYAHDFWNTAQTDGFLNLPAALAVLAFLRAQQRGERWAYAASGAAIGLAVLFKYPIGILLPLLWLCAALARRRLWRAVLWMSLGCALPLIGCAVWLYAQGALLPFVESQVRYITRYGSRDILGYGRWLLLAAILFVQRAQTLILGLGLSAAIVALRVRRGATIDAALLVVSSWFAAGVLAYLAQGKGYVYHGLPMLAPYALLGAVVVQRVVAGPRSTTRRRRLLLVALVTSMLALPTSVFVGRMVQTRAAWLLLSGSAARLDGRELCRESPRLCMAAQPGFSLPDQLAAADYIAAHSEPSDPLFIWGFEPTIYFVARREPASRFVFNLVLLGDWRWPELRAQLLDDLERRPPRYIVVASEDTMPMTTGSDDDSAAALQGFGELQRLIDAAYRLDATYGHLTLYRRAAP